MVIAMTLMSAPIRFTYTNWNDEEHEYVIFPESLELGPFTKEGREPFAKPTWVIHGQVYTRDGDARPEMGSARRRTFLLDGMREIVGVHV